MRILYFTGQIALHGGIEKVTVMKLNYWVETGNDVYLSTYEQGDKSFVYPISSKVHYEDLNINYNVDYTYESLYSSRCLKLVPKHFFRTVSLLKKIKPDVIIVPNFGYEFWFLPLIKGRSMLVREYHDSQYQRKFGSIKVCIDDFIQRFYDAVVVLTPQEVGYFKYKKNIKVIPNPIKKSTYISDLSYSKIVTVGRIDRVKRFELFIEIAELVIKKYPKYRFEIYGEGNPIYKNELLELIKSKKLQNNIFFMGGTSEIQRVFSEASIYVCTSKTESFGLTLIEAMGVGLPVISFDCPHGPKNIIHDGVDGYLIQNDSIVKASNAIINLIEDKKLLVSMGNFARLNAQRYHLDNVMKMWINLFNK